MGIGQVEMTDFKYKSSLFYLQCPELKFMDSFPYDDIDSLSKKFQDELSTSRNWRVQQAAFMKYCITFATRCNTIFHPIFFIEYAVNFSFLQV